MEERNIGRGRCILLMLQVSSTVLGLLNQASSARETNLHPNATGFSSTARYCTRSQYAEHCWPVYIGFYRFRSDNKNVPQCWLFYSKHFVVYARFVSFIFSFLCHTPSNCQLSFFLFFLTFFSFFLSFLSFFLSFLFFSFLFLFVTLHLTVSFLSFFLSFLLFYFLFYLFYFHFLFPFLPFYCWRIFTTDVLIIFLICFLYYYLGLVWFLYLMAYQPS